MDYVNLYRNAVTYYGVFAKFNEEDCASQWIYTLVSLSNSRRRVSVVGDWGDGTYRIDSASLFLGTLLQCTWDRNCLIIITDMSTGDKKQDSAYCGRNYNCNLAWVRCRVSGSAKS